MAEYEVLARGSGFFAQSRKNGVAALFSAHVAFPHRWRRYFTEEWLDYVRDEHCKHRLDMSGGVRLEIRAGEIIADEKHDAAAAMMSRRNLELIEKLNMNILEFDDDIRDEVYLTGYRLQGECGSGEEGMSEAQLEGKLAEEDELRLYLDTGDELSEFGMCGGPAVDKAGEKCFGLLEGRVENSTVRGRGLHVRAGQSALVPAAVLRNLLEDDRWRESQGANLST